MSNIYIPENCFTLDKSPVEQQRRIGLQGFGGSGKTYSALTFKDPIVLNQDRGLGAHTGRPDVVEVPFYNQAFCKKVDPNYTPDRLKDVLLKWMYKEAVKLTENQTLVIDGNTGIQNAYHRWWNANKHNFVTKKGVVDDFAEWTEKRTYFGELMELLKTLKCDVIYICHEVDQKDKNGVNGPSYSGKVRPLLTGSFGDEIVTHFTDWFRQRSCDKPDLASLDEAKLKLWGMTKAEFAAMCNTFPGNTIYFWQTEGDDVFDAKRSSLVNAPRFIPASYEYFKKYERKISQG